MPTSIASSQVIWEQEWFWPPVENKERKKHKQGRQPNMLVTMK